MQDKPAFDSRDPLAPAFWDERFAAGFTPWDQGAVPQRLQRFVVENAGPATFLLPGCGSGYELPWLMEQGCDAWSLDFSAAAVMRARQVAGRWQDRVALADFFDYEPPQPVDIIYERAFLCALPPAMWQQVAARWAQLLAPGRLLAGFFFFGTSPKGPPFGIARPALEALLTPHFACIEDEAVLDGLPVFAGQERWMVWQRR